ncbi:hypothetical protein Q7P37_000974 [Cladosporium fusiforme]
MLTASSILGFLTFIPTSVEAASCNRDPLFPLIADSSQSTLETASFFLNYFTAKSEHDAETWVAFFNKNQTYYYDAAVGGGSPNYTSWVAATKYYTDLWGDGATSYPVRILGDLTHGAVVQFTDTPQMFGSEMRILAAVDFRQGYVTRQIDYWDGRGTEFIKQRAPNSQYDKALGLASVSEDASPIMQQVARKLQGHFSTPNGTAAAQLFSHDGVLEEKTLRARLEGRLAVGAYLEGVLDDLPYGSGAELRHVLGNRFGGGYEWSVGTADTTMDVLNGITALELDEDQLITRCTIVWESSRVLNGTMRNLAERSVV